MTIYLQGNDYNENAEIYEFEPIPAGEYLAQIIEADKGEISSKNDYGDCLIFKWEIVEGEYGGRRIFQRLNLWGRNMNNNDKAVAIANSQFAEIRKATGVPTPRDTDELLYIPCLIRVVISQDKNKQYDPRNEIRRVKEAGGQKQPQAGQAARAVHSIRAVQATPWPQQAPAPAAQAPLENDEDIPF